MSWTQCARSGHVPCLPAWLPAWQTRVVSRPPADSSRVLHRHQLLARPVPSPREVDVLSGFWLVAVAALVPVVRPSHIVVTAYSGDTVKSGTQELRNSL